MDRAILEFAERLTLEPWKLKEEDVQRLRDVGLDDASIVDVILASAYRNFITRIADATGCEPEEAWKKADPEMAEKLDRRARRHHNAGSND